jgi:hypothetical protein
VSCTKGRFSRKQGRRITYVPRLRWVK